MKLTLASLTLASILVAMTACAPAGQDASESGSASTVQSAPPSGAIAVPGGGSGKGDGSYYYVSSAGQLLGYATPSAGYQPLTGYNENNGLYTFGTGAAQTRINDSSAPYLDGTQLDSTYNNRFGVTAAAATTDTAPATTAAATAPAAAQAVPVANANTQETPSVGPITYVPSTGSTGTDAAGNTYNYLGETAGIGSVFENSGVTYDSNGNVVNANGAAGMSNGTTTDTTPDCTQDDGSDC